MEEIQRRIRDRDAVVGVIGLGYVGLPLALVFSEAGFPVLGFDTDPTKVDRLSRGDSYIAHIDATRVAAATAPPVRLRATTDFSLPQDCDAILICLPTPLGRHREPDLSYVLAAAHDIARHLRPGRLAVLESTTYPGTTHQEVLPILASSGLSTPQDFWLAFSPEREDPGSRRFTTTTIPKVVGGSTRSRPKWRPPSTARSSTAWSPCLTPASPRPPSFSRTSTGRST